MYSKKKQLELQLNEDLKIKLNTETNAPILLTKYNFGENELVVQMPWKITISNTSNRPLSIIEYKVSQGTHPGQRYFSGIDGGVFNENLKNEQLPIRLDIGESKSLYIYVGAMIPAKNFDVLLKNSDGKSISNIDATIALAKCGMDLFGNKIQYRTFENGAFEISYDSISSSPKFWISVYTGNDNRFDASASKYEFQPHPLTKN